MVTVSYLRIPFISLLYFCSWLFQRYHVYCTPEEIKGLLTTPATANIPNPQQHYNTQYTIIFGPYFVVIIFDKTLLTGNHIKVCFKLIITV